MSWKDVLVIVSDAEGDEAALALGEALAGQCKNCHLAAAFLTPLPDEPLAYEPTVVAGVWAELLGRATPALVLLGSSGRAESTSHGSMERRRRLGRIWRERVPLRTAVHEPPAEQPARQLYLLAIHN